MVADLHASSPTAVELVNPKHRNEWKHHMALITSYHVPGLYVEDHSIDVPLDWRGLEPMLLAVGSTMRRGAMPAPIAGAPESIKLFYRVVCAPARINAALPLLLFLQGGPGGESPRPLSPTSDGWIEEAVKHFRVVLADQAAVPGAKISLLREGKVVAQTTADENGNFSLKAKRGSYELTAAYTNADGQLIYKTIDIKAPAKDLTVTF